MKEGLKFIATVLAVTLTAGWIADHVPEKGVLAEIAPTDFSIDIPDRIASALRLSDDRAPIESGPFSYRFEPGQALVYRMTAVADGLGFASGDAGAVGLTLNSDLVLYTMSVDRHGNAELLASFDNLELTGNYMGERVELYKRSGATSFSMGGHTSVDTARGDSIEGIPQLEFYDQPIEMTISPRGEVLRVDGPKGFDQMIAPSDMISMASFPSADLEEGDRWDSEFNLPIPGFDTPPKAKAENTFLGYEYLGERYCGVIRKVLTSDQVDGTISSPSSVFGDAMGFSMPAFSVTGINMIYFDVENGQLVYSDIDLNVALEIGEVLKPAAAMLGVIGSLLEEVEGGKKAPRNLIDPDEPLHELGIHIQATLTLMQ